MQEPSFPAPETLRLWRTLERLLAPDGCPWDREQQPADLARYLIEEGHEWLEACQAEDRSGQAEELGDLLYLVLFGMQLLARRAGLAPSEVPELIDAKLRRRRPHLFAAAGADAGTEAADHDVEAQTRLWERIKRDERGDDRRGLLKRLPASLGALAKSHRYQEKAATAGFDWPDLAGVLDKLEEEIAELREELDRLPELAAELAGKRSPSFRHRQEISARNLDRLRDELGDLFFVTANLCRWLGMDAESVAEAANAKFLRRFGAMEASLAGAGRQLEEVDLEEMEEHWRAVKRSEAAERD